MRWIAKESECAGGEKVWIAVDTTHPHGAYAGPFGTGRQAEAYARPRNRANWIEMLKDARENRKAAANT
jgi:hypothetical protein